MKLFEHKRMMASRTIDLTEENNFYRLFFAGTRIIYERAFLMNLKNSPLSKTPPRNLPSVLIRGNKNVPFSKAVDTKSCNNRSPPQRKPSDEHQFDIDL